MKQKKMNIHIYTNKNNVTQKKKNEVVIVINMKELNYHLEELSNKFKKIFVWLFS